MSIINARSPYIISIDEIGSSETSIEVRIWNGSPSFIPTDPTYTESKLVPSSSSFLTQYNIAPLIQGFLSHKIRQNIYSTYPIETPNSQWCNVRVKRSSDGGGINDVQYLAVNGYGTYKQGYNPILTGWLLDEGTYYYPYDVTIDPLTNPLRQVGNITIYEKYNVRYTNLNDLSVIDVNTLDDVFSDVPCVVLENIIDGNKVEIIDLDTEQILATYIFKPQIECYYDPITIDFVNAYGAWQRTFMYKAKYTNFDFSNTEYNLLQTDLIGYDIREGQRKTFNANGVEKIKMNTGWVDESYVGVLKQLLLSERVLINGSPAIALTKTLEQQDSLNVNLINYTLEFKYAYDYINTVV